VIDGDFSQEFRQHDARRLSRGVVVCGFTDAAFLSVVGPSDAARDCKAHPGGEAVPGWDCRDRLTIDNRPAHRTAASGPWGISSKSLLDRRFRQRRREQWPNCAEFLFSRIPSRAKYRCPKSISHYLSTFDRNDKASITGIGTRIRAYGIAGLIAHNARCRRPTLSG
jgi:hypothetical protein